MHYLTAGSYTVRITCLNESASRIDCLDFSLDSVAVEPATWGRIKTFYRP